MCRVIFFLFLLFSFLPLAHSISLTELHQYVKTTHTQPLNSYTTARRYLFGYLHYNKGKVKDVYCNRYYTSKDGVGKNKIPNHLKINCEHTWAQSKFNRNIPASIQKNDLHHLFPTAAYANTTRSNHPFGEVDAYPLSQCPLSSKGYIYQTNRLGFEPPEEHKGNVARAMFYFSVRYQIHIDSVQEYFLRKWHREDPVDYAEALRDNRISAIQGNHNPFILKPELVDQVSDF